jgi:hypothetical protein
VRCMAWHPHTRKLALASRDDCIRVAGDGAPLKPVLRHAGQRDISCLAWRPCCAGELGTATEYLGVRASFAAFALNPIFVLAAYHAKFKKKIRVGGSGRF